MEQSDFNNFYLSERNVENMISSTENYKTELQPFDPLENLGNELSSWGYYRLNCVVFAEPLNYKNSNKISGKQKGGRKDKNLIHLEDQSNFDCPAPNCTKSFLSPILLKTHIRKVHYSEKIYVCEVCGATFTALYLLKRHSTVHGSKRVQCPVCQKLLSLRTNLSQHLRGHSDTRRHECLACGKRFLRSSTMKVHLKTVHKDAMTTSSNDLMSK